MSAVLGEGESLLGSPGGNTVSLCLCWSCGHRRGPANALPARPLPKLDWLRHVVRTHLNWGLLLLGVIVCGSGLRGAAQLGHVSATLHVAGRGRFLGLEATTCDPERNY